MTGLLADFKHGLRLHLATPLSSGIAVIVLAVAMAFLTAFLSMWNDLALRDHPGFKQTDQLVSIQTHTPEMIFGLRFKLMQDIADNSTNLEFIAGARSQTVNWKRDGKEELIKAELVTDGFFEHFRPHVYLGQGFSSQQHQQDSESVAVISYDVWQREFNGRDDILGQIMDLGESANTFIRISDSEQDQNEEIDETASQIGLTRIIGVMHPSMQGTFSTSNQIWLAAERAIPILYSQMNRDDPFSAVSLDILAKLTPGATVITLNSELQALYANGFPDELWMPAQAELKASQGITDNPIQRAESLEQVQIFLIAGLLVVLVASINISLFLLSRTPGRIRELGIRMAVGATLGRLARQLVTESALLVGASVLLGFLFSLWLVVHLKALPFLIGTQWQDTSPLDWRVLLMVSGISVVIVTLISLAPIANVRKAGISASTRKLSSRASWFQHIGGSLQLAAALVMGAVALTFAWHLALINTTDSGFNPEHVIVVNPVVKSGFIDTDLITPMRERRREVLLSAPYIQQIAFGAPVPNDRFRMSFGAELNPPDQAALPVDVISADYQFLDLLETPVLRGQIPQIDESESFVINRALAEAYFGQIDVIGQTLPPIPSLQNSEALPVAAVVENIAFDHPTDEPKPLIFWPRTIMAAMDRMIVKTTGSVAQIRSHIEDLIEQGELELEVQDIYRLEDRIRESLAPERTRFYLSSAAGGVVLLLALFGFYGIQRYLVAAGKREYAIRAALGAGPKAIKKITFTRGLRIALPGIVFGALIAYITLAWLRDSMLNQQTPIFLLTLTVCAFLLCLTFLATAGPALQAARGRPAALLRED